MTVADGGWKDDTLFGKEPEEAAAAAGAEAAPGDEWALLADSTSAPSAVPVSSFPWRPTNAPTQSLEDLLKPEAINKDGAWQRSIINAQQPAEQQQQQQQLHRHHPQQQEQLSQQQQQRVEQHQRLRHPSMQQPASSTERHLAVSSESASVVFPNSELRFSGYNATSRATAAQISYSAAFTQPSAAELSTATQLSVPYAQRSDSQRRVSAASLPPQQQSGGGGSALSEATPQQSDAGMSVFYPRLTEPPQRLRESQRLLGVPQQMLSDHQQRLGELYQRIGDPERVRREPQRQISELQRLSQPAPDLSLPPRSDGSSDSVRSFGEVKSAHLSGGDSRSAVPRDLHTPPEPSSFSDLSKWRPPDHLQELSTAVRSDSYLRSGGGYTAAPLRPSAQLPCFPPLQQQQGGGSQRTDIYTDPETHLEQHFSPRPRLDLQSAPGPHLHTAEGSRRSMFAAPPPRTSLPYRPEPQRSAYPPPVLRSDLPYASESQYMLPDTWTEIGLSSRGTRQELHMSGDGLRLSPRSHQGSETYLPPPGPFQLSPGHERGLRVSPGPSLEVQQQQHGGMSGTMVDSSWTGGGMMLSAGSQQQQQQQDGCHRLQHGDQLTQELQHGQQTSVEGGSRMGGGMVPARAAADSSVKSPPMTSPSSEPIRCTSTDDGASLPSPRNEEEGPVTCRYCATPTTFESVASLAEHMPLRHGDRPFLCRWCLKAFKLGHHLKDHRRIHTGEKPFQCRVCSKSFTRHSILKAHTKVHKK